MNATDLHRAARAAQFDAELAIARSRIRLARSTAIRARSAAIMEKLRCLRVELDAEIVCAYVVQANSRLRSKLQVVDERVNGSSAADL
jgi:hypothetical protein